ncbi:MAG TPA: RagB/SusD family nutrient uptake outer membrane protein [Gemmatimonadaceae bacterium]|nr:RagB/SusD family nutrient uptake outer membrane protein [Gemmatimonadaceae bacterium]
MRSFPNRLAAVGLAAAVAASAACSDFLSVDNPGSVDTGNLADSANAALLVNGAIGEFQSMIATSALWGAILSDEAMSGHNNASYGPIDRRDFTELNDIVAGVYSPLQRARYAGDSVAGRLKGYQGEAAAAKDLRVARMLAFAGYGYVELGEMFCDAPIGGSAPLTPVELWQKALPRFEEAIAIVTAAKADGNTAAAGDSILNLALVGAARAALNLGDLPTAKSYASQVAPGFEYRAYYAEGIPPQPGLPTNPFWNGTGSPDLARPGYNSNTSDGWNYSSAAAWVVVGETFLNLKDPRVPHTPTAVKVLSNAYGDQYLPHKPKSFGGYVKPDTNVAGKKGGVPMTPGAFIRVASWLEAQYIIAEAEQGNANTLLFVNAQRTANDQPASTATTPQEVLLDLLDQRRREFWLDGHRLGDLRRYIKQYNIDQFPSGTYRGGSESYGSVTCFPIPLTERNSNPNVP